MHASAVLLKQVLFLAVSVWCAFTFI